MNVLLVGDYRPDAQESMHRYTNLLDAAMRASGHSVQVARPEPWFGHFGSTKPVVKKWLGYGDKFVVFPAQLKRALAWADVVHICDHGNAVYTRYLQRIPHVVTCHDLLAVRSAIGEFPSNRTSFTGRYYQRLILNGLNRARFVACDSRTTADDLVRLSSLDGGNVRVVHPCLNFDYQPDLDAQTRLDHLGLPPGVPFVFHVGGNQWYKNRPGVLSVFHRLKQDYPAHRDLQLVMAGKPWTAEMHRFVETHGLSRHVVELGPVSNEELRALYSGASAFLFPSLQEGFGWPVVEAQACGCPVVCSNNGSLAEVAGDGALTADASDQTELAHLLDFALGCQEEVRTRLIERGFKNARKYSRETFTNSFVSIYDTVMKN